MIIYDNKEEKYFETLDIKINKIKYSYFNKLKN